MAKTTIDIDDELFDQARSIMRTTGRSETVNAAPRGIVERHARQTWLDWWATDPLPCLRDPEVTGHAWR